MRNPVWGLPFVWAALLVLAGGGVAAAAPVPSASLSVPAQNFIGEPFTFTATFDNTSATPTDTGYGPFIDLIFPVTGTDGAGVQVDDGIDFVGATYLGAPVTAVQLPFPSPGGCVNHPYAVNTAGVPVQVCGTPGDKLVVLQLPFGSFVPNQPPAAVSVSATLSNLADLAAPLTIRTRAGFQFGATPLNDPATDPSILGPNPLAAADASTNSSQWTTSASVTPTLLTLTKNYIGPEDETATGPNYPRQYTITIDVADGQTITNLDVIDKLPNNLAFLQVISSTPAGGTVTTTPPVGIAANPPNNQLVVNFTSVTGGPGSSDATVTFEYFAPQFDANGASILNPLTGGCVPSVNDALATASWTPIDTRDSVSPVVSDETLNDHTIKLCALVIQKGVSVFTDTGPPGPSPGDTLAYTYQFQVSDFFTIGGALAAPGSISITDVMSDGQHFDAAFNPTLAVTDRGGTSSGSFVPGGNLTVDESEFSPCGDGTTTLTFNVSQQLIDLATNHPDGILQGGRAIAPDAGAATGTITYRAIIQDAYSCTVPSMNGPLNANDALSNSVEISGQVLDNGTLAPTGTTVETSGAGVVIAAGVLSKQIYARNGVVGPVTQFAAGDDLTYRIRRTLPLSDIEQFSLTDFLPLPVLQVADPDANGVAGPAWTFDPTVSAAAPAAGVAKFGPGDTFFALSGISPTVTLNAAANSLAFSYGTYDDPTHSTTTIEVLFTVRVTADPFADGLFLTNQVRDSEQNSFETPANQDAIVQFQLTEPVLSIKKGAVASDAASPVFSPGTIGPVSFTSPGGGCPRFAGTVNSNGLASTPINSNVSHVDAGDRVTFAMVVENTGTGLTGAFDVALRDALPSGFSIPGGGLNLCVTDGTGAAIAFTTIGAGLFDAAGGIQLTDPGPTASPAGALDPYSPTSGQNIAIVTYDLVLDGPVKPSQVLSNTATLFNFAAQEGGPDFTTTDLTDAASATVAPPQLAKVIQTIAPNGTGASSVTAGDTVTYAITVTLPEGQTPGLVLTDTLPAGFQFVAGSVMVVPGTFAGTVTGSPSVTPSGQTVGIDFGTVSVTADNNTSNNSFTVTLQALVLNDPANNGLPSAQNKTNTVTLSFTGSPNAASASVNTSFREPKLSLTKSMSPANADAGDTITMTITVTNTGTSPAYDVSVTDPLPADVFDLAGPVTPVTTPSDFTFSYASPNVSYTPNLSFTFLPVGGSRIFRFTAVIRSDVVTGSSYQNTATTTGDSQSGAVTQQRPTTAAGTSSISATQSRVVKNLSSTSESSTNPGDTSLNANPPVAIGEVLTYALTFTIPEGFTTNVTLSDVLPSGVTFFGNALLDRNTTGLTCAGVNCAAVNANVPGTPVPVTLSGTTTRSLALGTVINADNDPDAETYTLTLQVVVNNSVANNAGTQLNNRGRITFTAFNGTTVTVNSNTVSAHVAEPTLSIVKTAAPPSSQAGSLVTFTVVIANTASGANAASAFDWTFSDVLPPEYGSPVVTLINAGATGAVVAASFVGTTLSGTIDRLDPGEAVTVTYTATLTVAARFGQVVTNVVNTTASSLPGSNGTGGVTPGAAGSATGERTGTGGVNDLRASDDASTRVQLPTIAKTTLSPQPYYAIAETPTFEITLGVPAGSTNNFMVTDVLPAGLAYQAGFLTVTTPLGFTATNAPLTEGNTPLFFSQAGNTLTFNFGNVSVPTAGSIVITYRSLVQNVIANQDGSLLTNTATLTFQDPTNPLNTLTAGPVTNPAPVRVGEPNLDMSKVITAGATEAQAGDTVSWQVVVRNTGHTTAYQVDWQDVLPANKLFMITNAALLVSGGDVFVNGTTTPVTSSQLHVKTTVLAGDTLDLADVGLGDAASTVQIAPDATITITFDSKLSGTVISGETINNSTSTTYSSIATGGRTGSDGGDDDTNDRLNNYREIASQAFAVAANAAIDKTVSPTIYTIGQNVTYVVRVDVIQGTTPSVLVTDVLPVGVTYVSHSIAAGNLGMSFGNAAYDTRLGSGQTVQFNFGDVFNPDDGDRSDDYITIEITARVDNVVGNQAGTVLRNGEGASQVSLQFGSGPPTTVTFDHDAGTAGIQGLPITIVEPVLTVAKVANPASQSLGDVVTYTVTVQHAPTSTADAFDLVVNDTLPSGLTYVNGSASLPASDVTATAGNPNLQFRIASLLLSEGSKTFTYQVRIDLSATVGQPLANTARLTWASLAGATGAADSGRTGSGGVNDYATSAQAPITPNGSAAIQATKTVVDLNGGMLVPGDTLEYTVTLVNTNGLVTGVVFTDQVPVATTYVSGSLTTTLGTVNAVGAPSLVVNVGSMAALESVTIRFRVTVNALTPGGFVVLNQGSVDSNQTVAEPTDADGNDGNGDQPTTIVVGVTPTAGLRATKSVALTGDTVAPTGTINTGDTVTYTITLVNTGSFDLTNVSFADTVPSGPPGLVVTAITTSQGTTPAPSNSFSIADVGTIPVGGIVTITVSGTVVGTGVVANQGTATSAQVGPVLTDGNPNPDDGTQPTAFTVQPVGVAGAPQLRVSKTALLVVDSNGDGIVNSGERVRYTIALENIGSAAATSVAVMDPIPANASLVAGSVVTSHGVVLTTSPTITVNVGTLNPGETATVSFDVTVASGLVNGTQIANQATVTDAQGDNVLSDDPAPPGGADPTAFGVFTPNVLSGYVYEDTNNNGIKDPDEPGIAGVTITLTGTDNLGNAVSVQVTTGPDGSYSFTNVRPGTYTIRETQAAGFADGMDAIGSQGGTPANDQFSNIVVVGGGFSGTLNNFGERQFAAGPGCACDNGTPICQPPSKSAGAECTKASDCVGNMVGVVPGSAEDLCSCTAKNGGIAGSCKNGSPVGNRDDVPDACRSDCNLPSCGDGVSDAGEQCDDGADNGDNNPCLGNAPKTVCALGGVVVDNPVIPNATMPCATNADCYLVAGATCTGNPQCRLNVCGDRRTCTAADCISGSSSIFGAMPGAFGPEACDDGNTDDEDGCTSFDYSADIGGAAIPDRCQLNTCGDGTTNPDVEDCDAGRAVCVSGVWVGKPCCTNDECRVGFIPGECSGSGGATNVSGFDNRGDVPDGTGGNVSCRCTCKVAYCGDGISDSLNGEACDDGNTTTGRRDYCNAVRRCVGGENPNALCTSNAQCVKGTCGPVVCEQNACGDGILNNNEECDDGNTVAAGALDVCGMSAAAATANPKPVGCNAALPQNVPGACIPAACRLPFCGDGVTNPGEMCDADTATCTGGFNPGAPCALATDCKGGTCGAGNRDDVADVCRSNCMPPACGDGVIDSGEQCDDEADNGDSNRCVANLTDPMTGLTSQCVLNRCGDGKVCTDTSCTTGPTCNPVTKTCTAGGAPEQCDDGNTVDPSATNTDTCDGICVAARCGDGITGSDEQCDGGLGCATANPKLADCCFDGSVVQSSKARAPGLISVRTAFSALLGCRLPSLVAAAACDKRLHLVLQRVQGRVLAAQVYFENNNITRARRLMRHAAQRLTSKTLTARLAVVMRPGGVCAANGMTLSRQTANASNLSEGIVAHLTKDGL